MNEDTPVADSDSLRRDYDAAALREGELASEPVEQFRRWFDAAASAGVAEPNAAALATVDSDGAPRQRTVLVKRFAPETGFEFFTNMESDKARQLEERPQAGLLFFWRELHRQVIVSGTVRRLSRARAQEYFARRPRGAQLAAWASRQSRPAADRAEVEAAYAAVAERFAAEVPTPPHWGGFALLPDRAEFWQGRPNRLHDRVRYERRADRWARERLYP